MRISFENGFQKLKGVSEWVLIQRVKAGNREAFGKLYQLYLDRIYRFIYFRVNQEKELAEDITADVFIKAWSKIDTFEKGSFQAWLYMIARNTVIDYFRVHKKTEQITETVIDEKQNIEETVHSKLEIERVQQAIGKLTEEQQEVVILKFTNDLSNKEIARILQKREDAIRALQSRAIKQLRDIMQEEKL